VPNESNTHAKPHKPQKPSKEQTEQGSDVDPQLPKDEHDEELLDEALTETFPASDPIAIPTPQDERSK